jgi:sigma-E factor negative regulatory protein RseC
MTGKGLVLEVLGNEAKVQISKSSACGHDCTSCGACSNPTYEITVLNPIGAKNGDSVEIETRTSSVLGVSFLLYILPVFILIISALVCESYNLGYYSILVFGVLLCVWYTAIKLLNKKIKIQNVITKIIP